MGFEVLRRIRTAPARHKPRLHSLRSSTRAAPFRLARRGTDFASGGATGGRRTVITA